MKRIEDIVDAAVRAERCMMAAVAVDHGGASQSGIARYFGVDRQAVHKWVAAGRTLLSEAKQER